MSIRVLSGGLLTTLQDGGRAGWRHLGLGRSGALDPWSHALANLLAGNDGDVPTLEVTLGGPTLHFGQATRIALCGARIDAHVDGIAVPDSRPLDLPAGATLRLGACRDGARTYLAVERGFAAPSVLGSRSTDLRGGFGGVQGRALARGDILGVAGANARAIDALAVAPWWIDPAHGDMSTLPSRVRLLPGEDGLPPGAGLFERTWRVAAASDRQGLRLQAADAGDPPHPATDGHARTSEPVFPGTVQLPPDGRPIVLLADAQTHGGYPRIGHAIRADMPVLAQLRPGDALRFEACAPDAARRALWQQRARFARLALAIAAHGDRRARR